MNEILRLVVVLLRITVSIKAMSMQKTGTDHAACAAEVLNMLWLNICTSLSLTPWYTTQHVWNASSLSVFRRELKTVLFRLSFPGAI